MDDSEKRILIIQDDEEMRSLLKDLFEEEGFETDSVEKGTYAFKKLMTESFALIITDIQMPEKNGLQLMEIIRVHNPKVRTIYMSGDLAGHLLSLKEEQKRYPVGFLEKPFSKVELMKLLSEASL